MYDFQPTTSGVNRLVSGVSTSRLTATHQEDNDVNTDSSNTTDSDATIDIPVVSQCIDIEIEVGSFALIAIEAEGKGHTYYYVGEIRRQWKKSSYDVKFMRASAGSFIFPVIPESSIINTSQLICKLTVRNVQRGRYQFVEEYTMNVLLLKYKYSLFSYHRSIFMRHMSITC